jgi:hypothetical protein
MPVPWLQILDAVIGVTDLARSRKIRKLSEDNAGAQQQQLDAARAGTPGGLEARLAGVVVAALKEAFDRDSRRLELEREQANAERQRAERALQLELRRHAADREIGRLRLLAGTSVVTWIASLFLAARLASVHLPARFALGVGWLLLLAALAAAFSAQSTIAANVERSDGAVIDAGAAGALAPWLIVLGLALVGLAALVG